MLIVFAIGAMFFLRKRPKVELSLVSTGVARHSVAILGFKNLSGRPDTAWLSTALSEMLTTELGAGEKLLTISGENVARVKNDLAFAGNRQPGGRHALPRAQKSGKRFRNSGLLP